ARLIDVNLKGLVFGTHAAMRRFRAQGFGTLINVGSIDSEVPLAYQASYAATKAAVLSLGRSLNEELRIAGEAAIKVGTRMPCAVDTPWWTHAANYTGHAPRMAAMDDPQIVIDAIVDACVNPKEEQPVGFTAKGSYIFHRVFPNLSERMSADIAHREYGKEFPVPNSPGAKNLPMTARKAIDGGIRACVKQEDETGDNASLANG